METATLISLLFVLVLAVFAGLELFSKEPVREQTRLMPVPGAISGIVVVGAIVAANQTGFGLASKWMALGAIVLATINVVGGFALTGRMLATFKTKPKPPRKAG